MWKRGLLFLFFFVFLFSSCYQTAKIANQNLVFTYDKDAQVLHPLYSVYHTSPSKSELHFSINTQELLYMKSAGNANYSAKISVSYVLYSSYESKQILDSSAVVLEDDASKEENVALNGSIEFNATYPNHYILEILMMDMNRNQSAFAYVEVDKSTINVAQNFKLLNSKTGEPLFSNHVNKNESFTVAYDKNSAQKKLAVRYYKKNFPLPAPPFSVQNQQYLENKPDSVFNINLNKDFFATMSFTGEGFYQFQSDTLSKEGLTVFIFHEDFPLLTTPEQLIYPVRYITTKQEFDNLQNSTVKKKAVDDFWLNNCGNIDRAKAALKVYYKRVQNGNQYFTSYTEGWKTDRGLIYIAFGLPNSIYRDSNSETWIYGEEPGYKSLSFTFMKVQNQFSDNDYAMNRSENYRSDWFRMIDAWRQGKIINDK